MWEWYVILWTLISLPTSSCNYTVTNYLTKTTLRTIAHATPLVSANKFWTALQKNKHCRTVKIMSRNIHHYNYCSSLARWYKWYLFLFLPGPVNIQKGKESKEFLNYSYRQTKRSRESSLTYWKTLWHMIDPIKITGPNFHISCYHGTWFALNQDWLKKWLYLLSRGPQWLLCNNHSLSTWNPSLSQPLGQCLLHNDHHGPRLNKYDLCRKNT